MDETSDSARRAPVIAARLHRVWEELPVPTELYRRLSGEACIECGAVAELAPSAGAAYVGDGAGGEYGWHVKVCPRHRTETP